MTANPRLINPTDCENNFQRLFLAPHEYITKGKVCFYNNHDQQKCRNNTPQSETCSLQMQGRGRRPSRFFSHLKHGFMINWLT